MEWNGITVSAEQVQYAYMAALDGTFARVQKADAWIKEHERGKLKKVSGENDHWFWKQ